MYFLNKVNIELPYDPAIPLLGINPKELEIGIQTNTCSQMFTATWFTIVKRWKQPRYPSVDEWINIHWFINPMGYYLAIKSNEVDTCYNLDEAWKYYAKQKKLDRTDSYCMIAFYMTYSE